MYSVIVFLVGTGEAITCRDFEFGTFAEIGLWLDYYGYNSERYYALINFVEFPEEIPSGMSA